MGEKRKIFEFQRFICREMERKRVSCSLKGIEMYARCNGKCKKNGQCAHPSPAAIVKVWASDKH